MSYRIALILLALVLMKPVLAQTCPAGNPLVAPNSRYQVSEPVTGQRVVQDLRTGLMWKQCVQGRSGADCTTGADSLLNWSQALVAAGNETHAGFSDWRLPSIIELRSLVESGCHGPAINTTIFPNTASAEFWSSTTWVGNASDGWLISFDVGGRHFTRGKGTNRPVRLVRGGQSLESFSSALSFTPDRFSFAAQTGVPLSDLRTSASITVGGIDTVVGIGVSGAADSAYSINGGPFLSTPGAVSNGDTVVVHHTSADTELTSVTTTLQVGALTADFVSITTSFHTIGGAIMGLAPGNSLVLQNNETGDLNVNANGGFTFATPLPDGADYDVTVLTQPRDPNQTCVVANANGTVSGTAVDDIEVTCTTDTYVVTTNATNGSITSTVNPEIKHGQTTTVTGTASPNHYLASVSGCGGTPQINTNQAVDNFTYDTGPITAACTVEAVFAIRNYEVTATHVGNGGITPPSQTIDHGDSASFNVMPDHNHNLVSVTGDNCTPTDQAGGIWIASNITQNCAVIATFAINTYTVTTTAINGAITSLPNPVVDHGESTTVNGQADANHYFVSASGCGGTSQSNIDQSVEDFSYETGPITKACTVEAVFARRNYTVTTTAINGEITSAEDPVIDHGDGTTVTGQADLNHYFASVSGCGGVPQSNPDQSVEGFSYKTGPITEACTVEAVFALRTYTVTTTAINGEITSTENPEIDHGNSTTVTGQADPNHYFASVSGCGGAPQSNSDRSVEVFSYETGPITEACTIEAIFALRNYNISASVTQGQGKVDVLTPTVDHGGDAAFEIKPETGWSLASLTGDSCAPIDDGAGIWTAENITADCAADAVFIEGTETLLVSSMMPAIVDELVTYTIMVTGSVTAPVDGKVELSSDIDGVICSIASSDAVNSNTVMFTCHQSWREIGSHQLTASFSDSATHGESSEELLQQIVADEIIFDDRFEVP